MKKHSISGYILVNKPLHLSSFDVVAHLKRLLACGTKVGHAGTLDPFAQGLLLIGIGREATAHFKNLAMLDKTYRAQGQLGTLTDTLDCTGTPISPHNKAITLPSKEQLMHAIQSLGASYYQAPPIFSALKFKGKRLYALARAGAMDEHELLAIADLKKRLVDILSLTLENYELPFFTIETRVSHGTYIRSLVNDIARNAGSCATTTALTRLAVGPLTLHDACELSALTSFEAVQANLIPTGTLLHTIKSYLQAQHKAAVSARLYARKSKLNK
jgi:tRNA pseudouridine55 synthase